MIDALGSPQSVLVLGGTSEIALATVRALPPARLRRIVLAGRDVPALERQAGDLAAAGLPAPEVVAFDALDTASHGKVLDAVFEAGDIDITLLAFGVLGDQEEAERDPEVAVRTAQINYVGGLSAALQAGRRLREQGHGTLVVFSSVAGMQARRANFVYGSTKAGLDALALGLGDALAGSGVHVLVVRPGFVKTRMTAHLRPAPLAVDADQVGRAVAAAIRQHRTAIYVPTPMRAVAGVLRALPRPVLRRLPF